MKRIFNKTIAGQKNYFCLLFIFAIIITNIVKAQDQVDVGIFESTPDTLVIKAKPNYNISNLALTNVQFTIKWSETSQVTSTQAPFSYINWVFGISAQGSVVTYNGYRYQIYAAVNGNLIDWTAEEEYPICEIVYNYSGGDCTEFEIASDSWTAANNGEYYFEVIGANKTGIIYEPIANLGSEGGFVTGSATICLGDNTGDLNLVNYCCTVNKWQKRLNSGSWTDISSTSTQYSEFPSSAGTWEYRAEVQRSSCPVDYSLPAVIMVESATTWTGSSDSNWDDPGNWTICGVPDATIDAIIPDVSKAPFPIISSAATCNALTIQTGAGLVIAYNGSLTLSGNFINDGSFTIESLATGTGSFIDNGNISGTAKVQRYLTDNSGLGTFYHHQVCAPVNNQTLSDFNLIPGSTYAYEYDPATGEWVNLYSLTASIPPMKGIMLSTVNNNTPHTVNFIDALVTGNTSIAVTGNPSPAYHNLVGNPYPSPIHWDEINPHAGINNIVYIWDPSESNYKNYVEVTGGDISCKYIQIGQAFFIECTSSTSFQVTNSARVHNNAPYLKDGYVDYLKLMTAGGTNSSADETYIHFMDDVTTGYDVNYDAKKWHSMHNDFFNAIIEATEIYTIASDNNLLSINGMPMLGKENVSIPLHFVPGSNGEYNITASYIETFANGTEIYLEDLLTGDDWHALHIYPEYTFNATQDDQYNRFILHFFGPAGIDELNNNAIKIYSDRNYAYIINKGNERIKEIQVYDLLGNLIIHKTTPDNSFIKLYVNEVKAYYLVKVITDKHIYTEKVFITR